MDKTSKAEIAAAQDMVFAMDIGTRSVIGVVGVLENQLLRILDVETIEHEERSVIDGQIEDIDKVSRVSLQVKERLENRLGLKFTNVCVAAAGRALKTQMVSFEFSVDFKTAFTQQMIFSLEMGAVDEAKNVLAAAVGDGTENVVYSCVGYSVIRYFLDGYPLKTLLNHKGSRARVELIATFLPIEVVESLTEAMRRADLRVGSLTLEPIAAMNVVIPQELRLLNLALVDVGAGTSDIAISNDGSVAAYAMATVAGDEITEAIAKEYLVDFHMAEKMKFALSDENPNIQYQNILGFEYAVSPADVRTAIRPAIENLGNVISEKILEINTKPPAAVFLVGGGSRTPGLAAFVADRLGIDHTKVAVGGGNYIKRNVVSDLPISGPEYATPLGIAVTAAMNLGEEGFFVYVNDIKTRLFKRELITVMDALMMAGHRHDQIIGRSGSSLTILLNRQKKVIRGELYEPAEIYLNDKPAAVSTLVNFGDRIIFTPSVSGKDAVYTVRDVLKEFGNSYVIYNKEKYPIKLTARINGKPAKKKEILRNNDEVMIYSDVSVADLCVSLGLDPQQCRFYVNGTEKDGKTKIKHGDMVDFRSFNDISPTLTDIKPSIKTDASEIKESARLASASQDSNPPKTPLSAAKTTIIPGPGSLGTGVPEIAILETIVPTTIVAGLTVPPGATESAPPVAGDVLNISLNGKSFDLPKRPDGSPNLFLDLFSYVDIDTSNPQGKIILRINEHEASYLEPLSVGDDIRIYWEKLG